MPHLIYSLIFVLQNNYIISKTTDIHHFLKRKNNSLSIKFVAILLFGIFALYQCMSDACQTEFTGVNEEGGVDDKMVKQPVGNYSMIVDREDVLVGVYHAPSIYF